MTYQIIFFDLDDTLVDFKASERISLQHIHTRYYQEINYEFFTSCYREINDGLWKRVGSQHAPLMPSDVRFLRFKYLNEQLGCQLSAHEIAAEHDHNLSEYVDWLPNVKKAIEFLHQKGHILGIITNGLADSQGKKHQKLGLYNWFDCFVVSDEEGIAKPDKKIFDIALERIANKHQQPIHTYDKQSMLMVGDTLYSDGFGAKNFGINYCHIAPQLAEQTSENDAITYHIHSVATLPLHLGYEAEYHL